MQAYFEP